jgi:putative transcriptional regulator
MVPDSSSPVREPDFAAMRLRLARLRQQRGWSYNELAARSGVGRNTLVTLENGKPRKEDGPPETHGTLLTWYRIAEALDMTLGELLAPLQPHRSPDTASTEQT